MNLLECDIPYFTTTPEVLKLRPKALKNILHLQNAGDPSCVPQRRTYLERIAQRDAEKDETFLLPAKLDFGKLSYAAKKTLIACYWKAKYSRTPFRFICTREQLADTAHIGSPRIMRKALKELEQKRLIEVKQLWRKGSQISLLDPEYESGTALFHIAMFNREHFERIPAYRWYRTLLHDESIPEDTRHELDDRETDYTLPACPFCAGRKCFKVTLIQNSDRTGYEKDRWNCYKCKRGGDVRRLWGLLHIYIGREFWREALMRKEVGEVALASVR